MERQTQSRDSLATDLSNALTEALSSGDTGRWVEILQTNSAADPLAEILASQDRDRLFEKTGQNNLESWLADAKRWKEEQYRDPREAGLAEVRILYETWAHLESGLIGRLTDAAMAIPNFPASGGVLCFVAELKLCVVVRFQFHGGTPTLSPLAVIKQPKAAFDIWETINTAEPDRRGALRKMLVSGHKLIYHRGVLIHVDRRDDATVFGPSIDTLVMAELLARDVYEQQRAGYVPAQQFLEIGTGSGMLCASALSQLGKSGRIVGVEIDFGSLSCTYKNLLIANGGLDPIAHENCALIGGEFDPTILTEKFDLIVCNPPYIAALEKALPNESGTEDYLRAVGAGGTGMIDRLLAALPQLLKPEGKLLLMLNNMAVEPILAVLPDGFTGARPFGDEGYPVLFEVEAVFERTAVLKQLLNDDMLTPVGDAFEHTLHPLWIQRQAE